MTYIYIQFYRAYYVTYNVYGGTENWIAVWYTSSNGFEYYYINQSLRFAYDTWYPIFAFVIIVPWSQVWEFMFHVKVQW